MSVEHFLVLMESSSEKSFSTQVPSCHNQITYHKESTFLPYLFPSRSSHHGSVEMNPTSIHEDAGLIPGLRSVAITVVHRLQMWLRSLTHCTTELHNLSILIIFSQKPLWFGSLSLLFSYSLLLLLFFISDLNFSGKPQFFLLMVSTE